MSASMYPCHNNHSSLREYTTDAMTPDYGLVCAPNSVHKEVLNEVQQVLQAHGPIPWTR